MDSWHTYPSIYALGHRAVTGILDQLVIVEEKVDGSQMSFGKDLDGTLHFRSKGKDLIPNAPEKMFALGVEAILGIADQLHPGWTYRGEYLQKPKHNSLAYSRVPNLHIILFDINTDHEYYASHKTVEVEGKRLGLETVPLLHKGPMTVDMIDKFLEQESILGGTAIEGVVIKPLKRDWFGPDKKLLMAKFVSEKFKEVHSKEWKKSNPTSGDMLMVIGSRLATPARWEKAIQHLRDDGRLDESPRDIGPLLKEVVVDVHKECEDEVKAALFKWAWPHIQRQVTRGLPEWYKRRLAGLPDTKEEK